MNSMHQICSQYISEVCSANDQISAQHSFVAEETRQTHLFNSILRSLANGYLDVENLRIDLPSVDSTLSIAESQMMELPKSLASLLGPEFSPTNVQILQTEVKTTMDALSSNRYYLKFEFQSKSKGRKIVYAFCQNTNLEFYVMDEGDTESLTVLKEYSDDEAEALLFGFAAGVHGYYSQEYDVQLAPEDTMNWMLSLSWNQSEERQQAIRASFSS